jgi:prophage regulatory protein
MQESNSPNATRLIRLNQVKTRTGLSRSEIYRRVRSGNFPAPVKLGPQTTAWCAHEVTAWVQERLAERAKVAA